MKSTSFFSVVKVTGVLLTNVASADTDEELESRKRDLRIGYDRAPVVPDSEANGQWRSSVVIAVSLQRPAVDTMQFKQ